MSARRTEKTRDLVTGDGCRRPKYLTALGPSMQYYSGRLRFIGEGKL